MINYLPIRTSTAKQTTVMHLFARLILLFAFAASTIHAPAVAHENLSSQHDHHSVSAHDATSDHHSDEEPAQEGAGESLHHHHCPNALDTNDAGIALGALPDRTLLSRHPATVLTSFSQAPPTEPPAA
jgi:hypothetical protein